MDLELEQLMYVAENGASKTKKNEAKKQAVLRAAEVGDLGVLKKLEEQKVSLKVTNKLGDDLVMLAAMNGHKDCVEFLLDKGASVARVNSSQRFLKVVEKGFVECASLLIQTEQEKKLLQKFVKDYVVNGGTSDLSIVWQAIRMDIEGKCRSMLDSLAKKKDDQDGGCEQKLALLEQALSAGDDKALNDCYVDLLKLSKQSRISIDPKLDNKDLFQRCQAIILEEAGKKGDVEYIDMLTEYGVDINLVYRNSYKTDKYEPILVAATKAGQTDCVKSLLDKGLSPDELDSTGEVRVLEIASGLGNIKLVESLVDRGASDIANGLLAAAGAGRIECMKFYFSKGLNCNSPGKLGVTPLMKAVTSGQLECTRFLMENGADTNAKTENGRSVVAFCVEALTRGVSGEAWQCIKTLLFNSDYTSADFKTSLDHSAFAPRVKKLFEDLRDGAAFVEKPSPMVCTGAPEAFRAPKLIKIVFAKRVFDNFSRGNDSAVSMLKVVGDVQGVVKEKKESPETIEFLQVNKWLIDKVDQVPDQSGAMVPVVRTDAQLLERYAEMPRLKFKVNFINKFLHTMPGVETLVAAPFNYVKHFVAKIPTRDGNILPYSVGEHELRVVVKDPKVSKAAITVPTVWKLIGSFIGAGWIKVEKFQAISKGTKRSSVEIEEINDQQQSKMAKKEAPDAEADSGAGVYSAMDISAEQGDVVEVAGGATPMEE